MSTRALELRTDRLVLRRWREEDLAPFAALNGDPETMRHFPATLSRDESDALVHRVERHFEKAGYGLFAVEVPGVTPFIGFVGLWPVDFFEISFAPAVEIGWRLDKQWWGNGYATEGAAEVLRFAFSELGLDEVVSFTAEHNVASQRVMQRIGMTNEPADNFEHPRIALGHPLRPHVLYRITRTRWEEAQR
jgi:RimJ/RimL family protein N-acetyltransferase